MASMASLRIIVAIAMALSFRLKRIAGLRTFLPTSSTTRRHYRYAGPHTIHHPPSSLSLPRSTHVSGRRWAPMKMTQGRSSLRSTSSSSSLENNGPREIMDSSSLDSYLSQLRAKDRDRLTADEAQSIVGTLSNLYEQDDATKSIINESIDAYIQINKRKLEIGQPIEQPGFYVRSIARRKLMETEQGEGQGQGQGNSAAAQSKKYDIGQQQLKVEPTGNNDNLNLLQPFLKNNDIEPNELDENCMIELNRCPPPMADYALKTYIKQKKRREMNGIEKISGPSSYVMAILRNRMAEEPSTPPKPPDASNSNDILRNRMAEQPSNPSKTPVASKSNDILRNRMGEQPLTPSKTPHVASNSNDILRNRMAEQPSTPSQTMDAHNNNGQNSVSTPTKRETVSPSVTTESPPPMKRPSATNKSASESTKPQPMQHIPQQKSTDQPQMQQKIEIQETKHKPALDVDVGKVVDMEYVNKCLSHLVKLEQPIIQLAGVGPKTETAFHKLGVYTLRDLLWHFPRSFIDRSKFQKSIHDVADGEVGTFRLKVCEDTIKSNSVTCTDEAGNKVDVIFFYGRSRQGMTMASVALKKLCKTEEDIDYMIVSGKIKHSNGKAAELFNPDIVVSPKNAEEVLGIEPVYALSSGLTQKKLVAAIDNALEVSGELLSLLPESLPPHALETLSWPKLADALILAHKPTEMDNNVLESPARQRIAFEEMSIQQAQLALSRWKLKYSDFTLNEKSKEVYTSWRESPLVSAAVSSLPFALTPGQTKSLDEMWGDAIGGDGRMLRLLQGDVGTGKTVLSYLLGLGCIESRQGGGGVVSLLCPTQLLAAQHFRSISDFAAQLQVGNDWNIHVELLTGSVVGKSREELLARLEDASDKDAIFLIGTHALASPDVAEKLKQLPNGGLALAVVDEEQRFGTSLKEVFASCAAHSLYMSATPIPRSISLMKSGMMDITLLEAEPRSVETTIVSSDNVAKVLAVLGSKIDAGSKCFWVLPRIERSKAVDEQVDSSDSQRSDVMGRFESLVKAHGEERVCYVHGRMTERDREEQLARFADPSSKAAVLVGTTVIEVGIDIPDVNILVVEDADRFGLSQLHQLRGRIGRAGSRPDLKCNCLLLSSASGDSQNSFSRLEVLRKSSRGDQIADADFMLRGPGDMLGFSQSGIKNGLAVSPANHWGLLGAATKFGRSFLQEQPNRVTEDVVLDGGSANDKLVHLLSEGKIDLFYDQSCASSSPGFVLRLMMSLFAQWKGGESNAINSINVLQSFDESKGELSQDDKLIHATVVDLAQTFCNESVELQKIAKSSHMETPQSVQPSASKPHLAAFQPQAPRINLSGDDIMFIVLDVETTGLDDKSCHVIQLAAKVLGSNDDKDLFSEYILPPVERIPKKIEELTGITDDFLRNGGFDAALGKEIPAAREFRQVYVEFQAFCQERAKSKGLQKIVLVAHNAKFDVRMINGELLRWRFSEDASSVTLSDTFSSSLDTLTLFRERNWWRSNYGPQDRLPRPSSFRLGELHSYVLNESASNSHNAVGDIKALEKLLLSKNFDGWKRAADKHQTPFVKVNGE